ncbi:biotin/lipoyl-containing protein [Nguyenibacter sp. L1]|uniref:acetyl-CoA carboxylase biotin carboxyl carrier protein n=1 Tax=Nguyenibacter sp. L1 TaxID=3049350 RepID=UPI002B489530|nr:biotin/lipoyl-containing protein [Nguyenibacter sp. L1]WRH87015.1 biotin/lipoyl-containing protein [Nguyenibacter sp. L1]
MDIQHLKRLIDLVARGPIRELEIEEGGQSIRLVRGDAGAPILAPILAPVPAAAQAAVPLPAPLPDPPPVAAPQAPRLVTAPTYGVFHLSPSPGAPPYVVAGQDVQAGQQVGLVEAMKVFNAVKTALSGRIAEILVQDGAEVEAGAPLFRLA